MLLSDVFVEVMDMVYVDGNGVCNDINKVIDYRFGILFD